MSELKDFRATIDPIHLARLVPFVPAHDIRYYLNGIYVEKAKQGGCYLVATDGHTMVIIHDAKATLAGAESLIFRVGPGLAAAAKTASNKMHKNLAYRLLVEGQRVKIATDFGAEGDAELFVQAGRSLIEGKFPDWRKVVPDLDKLKPGFGDGMNAHYLARLSKLTADRRFSGVTLWQAEATKAIVARLQTVTEMIVVMMPLRLETETAANAFKGFPFEKVPEAVTELEPA